MTGTWFLNREVELAAITLADVTLSPAENPTTAVLNLPNSKVDLEAKGARRSLTCTCSRYPGSQCEPLCPVKAVVTLVDAATAALEFQKTKDTF